MVLLILHEFFHLFIYLTSNSWAGTTRQALLRPRACTHRPTAAPAEQLACSRRDSWQVNSQCKVGTGLHQKQIQMIQLGESQGQAAKLWGQGVADKSDSSNTLSVAEGSGERMGDRLREASGVPAQHSFRLRRWWGVSVSSLSQEQWDHLGGFLNRGVSRSNFS